MAQGGCLCRGIRYNISTGLKPIQICHCSRCRKAQGSAFGTNTPVAVSDFELVSGKDLLKGYESSPAKKRFFCLNCGSPIYSYLEGSTELRIRAGLLDEPIDVIPECHIYTDSNCTWWDIQDDLPQYPESVPVSKP